jgi:hypothetical protein
MRQRKYFNDFLIPHKYRVTIQRYINIHYIPINKKNYYFDVNSVKKSEILDRKSYKFHSLWNF